ncbi:8600_t:CDS:2, partial [Acaulospora morrowiae]
MKNDIFWSIKIFNYTDFGAFKLIDKGGYGNIYKTTYSGKVVVLKELNKDKEETILYHEITLLKKVCPHPNINTLLGITK